MASVVTRHSISERQSEYLGSHYLVLQITVVSVALAVAGLSSRETHLNYKD